MSVLIGRRINGISINQLEYVVNEKGVPITFENEVTAKNYLLSKGTKPEDLDYYEYPELPKDITDVENVYETYDNEKKNILNKIVRHKFIRFIDENENTDKTIIKYNHKSIQDVFNITNPQKAKEELHELDMRNWLYTHNNIRTEDIHEIEFNTYKRYQVNSNDINKDITKIQLKLSNSKDTNFLDLCSFTTKEGKLITKIDFESVSKFFDSEGNEIDIKKDNIIK